MFYRSLLNINKCKRSITAKLTFLYTSFTIVLLVVIAGLLYWTLYNALQTAGEQFLTDEIHIIKGLIFKNNYDFSILKQEINGVPAELQNASYHYYVRLFNKEKIIQETPHMEQYTQGAIFPALHNNDIPKIIIQHIKGKRFLLASAPIVRNKNDKPLLFLNLALDMTYQYTLMSAYVTKFIISFLLAIILTIFFGYYISRRGLKTLHELATVTKQITIERLGQRIDMKSWPTELLSLGEGFNTMLNNIENSFKRFSQCTNELAHELRTPINNLMLQTETVLARNRTAEDYRQALESNFEEHQRLIRMVENILFLARADNPRTCLQLQTIDAYQELNRICEFYSILAMEKNIKIELIGNTTPLNVDLILFERAMSNILKNAIQYSHSESRISVLIDQDGQATIIAVSDTGAGIAAEHLPYVCERFYRVNIASSLNQGLGLGLAIVKSIMQLHKGELAITSLEGQGSVVTMRFC